MSDSKQPTGARRTDPSALFSNRSTSTDLRISALVADAGLGCKFQSIVSAEGAPFAEIAVIFVPDGERLHDEGTIRRAAGPTEFARGAAAFRLRAATEFAEALGLSPNVRLFLPHCCMTAEVEQFGPSLAAVLESSRLPAARVIVELLPRELEDARARELRCAGLSVALRLETPDGAAREAMRAFAPDFLHFTRPPGSMEEIERMRAFIDAAAFSRARVIIGGVAGSDDYAAAVEGPSGQSLFHGDAIASPRFLC